MIECKWCGKPFDNSEKYKMRKLYCSSDCYNESNRENARKNSKNKPVQEEKECECCGKKFVRIGRKQIYCTPECREEVNRSTAKERRKNKPKPKKKKICDLIDLNRQALEHGMSYGKYVAMLEGGMK